MRSAGSLCYNSRMSSGNTPHLIGRLSTWLLIALLSLSCRLFAPPAAEPARLVRSDDFSNPQSGWSRVANSQGIRDYGRGVYRLRLDQPDLDLWVAAGLNLSEVRVEVYAMRIGQQGGDRFGVICRLTPEGDFYAFWISSQGQYGIGKTVGQEFTLLSADTLQPSSAILTGNAFNHLRADCLGNELTLTVNGQRVGSVRDETLRRGDVGLIAGSEDFPGVEIYFDNFSVYTP